MLRSLVLMALNPLNWCIILFLAGLVIKNKKIRKRIWYFDLAIFIIFSNTFFINEAMRWYEDKAPVPPPSNYETGIVLGGFANIHSRTGKIIFTGAADRLMQAMILYKKRNIKKLLISGGNANVNATHREADLVKDYLVLTGIPPEDIIVERESRNTKENITFSFKKLDELHLKGNVVIITSAWHIPRTRKIVEHAGIHYHVDYFPTNFYTDAKADHSFSTLFIPSLSAFGLWQVFLKELVGLWIG